MTEPHRLAVGWVLGAGAAAFLTACGDADPPAPRAVFLVVVDTLRPDHLSCYGYEGHRTPQIDRLATAGALFTHAYSNASWTIPSMGSILTARYPTQLGLIESPPAPGRTYEWREARKLLNYAIPGDAKTLAEVFRAAGWATAAFVNQPGLNAREGFQQGFEEWVFPASPTEIRRYEPGQKLPVENWPPFLSRAASLDSALASEFESWMRARDERPVFVWLHFLTPHRPYLPFSRFLPAAVDPRSLASIDAYDAEIRFIDDLVGEVFRIIEETDGLERSLVVFTSDHGEAFGEHGMTEHGHSLHAEVLRVPLIVADRGRRAGRRIETAVQTLDLMPTILSLSLGPESVPAGSEGVDLADVLNGAPRGGPLYFEGMLYGETERALQDDRLKLMYDEQRSSFSLFDVESDPGETLDLAERRPETSARLRSEMDSIRGRLIQELPEELEGVTPEVLEALRALGYVE